MCSRSISKIHVASVLILVVLSSSFQCTVRAQKSLDQVVVLYDASHRQQFAPDDADQGLKLMLDMVNVSTRYVVKVNNDDPLNDTTLSGVDVLILASPDKSNEFTDVEVRGIAELLHNGSSLFVLGDPSIDQNSTYWNDFEFQDLGENIAINRLLDALNITGARYSINHTIVGDDEYWWGDTMFDYEHALNTSSPSIIRLDSSTWDTTHPIFKDINEIITMTSTLKPMNTTGAIAKGYDTSFAQYRRGPNTFANISFPNMSLTEFAERPLSYSAINGTFPPWLAAFKINRSRIVMSGSTIMFSARELDLPEDDARSDEKWFYQGDNRFLFMNILDWLSEEFIETPTATTYMLVLSAGMILVGVVYYIAQKKRR